jgi:hypothetical protein
MADIFMLFDSVYGLRDCIKVLKSESLGGIYVFGCIMC